MRKFWKVTVEVYTRNLVTVCFITHAPVYRQ